MLRTIALSLLVLFQTAQPAQPSAEAAKKALDQIQGTWQVATFNGETAPAGVDVHLTFTADKYEQWANGNADERGSFKLNPATKPASIDLMIAEGSDAGKLQLGVYEINGDTLNLTFSAPSDPIRPKTLSDGAVVVTLKKGKS
ncbi:MAG TPA: TIGR03067 domain-containing protein [Vicinamibacterales bacterium]|nr:TIGR03067 domain-containing protein [Vicinamibacterales bacterium]